MTTKIYTGAIVALVVVFVLSYGLPARADMMGPGMMQYVEGQALGDDELHEEMETLMTKMMTGEMSQEEAVRMTNLMNQYPGPYGMMMNRMGMMGTYGWQGGPGMMHGWGAYWGGVWLWLLGICWLVWTTVGILAAVWLWKQVKKQ